MEQNIKLSSCNETEGITLASRGLEEPFFQLCCCVSFLFWWEIGCGLHTTYVLRSTIKLWCCV